MVTLPIWFVAMMTVLATIGAGTVGTFLDRIMKGKPLPREWQRPRVIAKDPEKTNRDTIDKQQPHP